MNKLKQLFITNLQHVAFCYVWTVWTAANKRKQEDKVCQQQPQYYAPLACTCC